MSPTSWGDFDIDLASQDELKNMVAAVIQAIKNKDGGGRINGFNDEHVGKPMPWDGEKEE